MTDSPLIPIERIEQGIKYDPQFSAVFQAIRRLMAPPRKARREIGFHTQPNPK